MVTLILKLSNKLLGTYGAAACNYEWLCGVLWCFSVFVFDIRIDSSFWRCCHLISSTFLASSFYWRLSMGMWECASVWCCIYFDPAIFCPSFPYLPILFIVLLQISHLFFVSIFESFFFIIILFPFPSWLTLVHFF